MAITIYPAKLDEATTLATVHYHSWMSAYHDLLPQAYIEANNNLEDKAALWSQVLAQPKTTTLIAKDERSRSLGFISYYQAKSDLSSDHGTASHGTANDKGSRYEITTLYVQPENQSKGIGQALMSAALQQIAQVDPVGTIALWVLKSNQAAINFYIKQGFSSTGEEDVEEFKDGNQTIQIIDIKMAKLIGNR